MITKMNFKKYIDELKVLFISILLIVSLLLNYCFQIILDTDVIFSHFFYIPIICACFWWKKKGLIIPILLAGFLILFPLLFRLDILSLLNIDNLLRALLLIINGIIISTLSENISKTEKLTKDYKKVKFYRDLLTHDINNILQNILSATELYSLKRKNGKNMKDLDELMNITRSQGFRAINLVSNVRKLAKLEESEIRLEKINVFRMFEEVITYIQRSYQERKINISIDAQSETIWAKANELLLNLFENILINAVKHNDNSNVEINVKILREINYEINYIKIEIMDNGIGISDNRKETIFKRRSNKGKYSKGMGFGLSLVKKIINMYNGKIWVEDKVKGDYSQGSNFIILIPETFK